MQNPLMLLVLAAAMAAGADLPDAMRARNQRYADEIEQYFRDYLVRDYPDRARQTWTRSYASVPAFLKSVEPNRERYRRMLAPPDWKPAGPLERKSAPAKWPAPSSGSLCRSRVVSRPKGFWHFPKVRAGPCRWSSRSTASAAPPSAYSAWATPKTCTTTTATRCSRPASPCWPRLIWPSSRSATAWSAWRAWPTPRCPGIEFTRMSRLLDEVLKDKRIDKNRVGMWGISLGGMATMFWMPLEPRIQCGVVCAWFNHRRNKMVIPDKRYSCFLETTEEHAFFRGWLTEFTDSDVASLICPRPLLVQTGKADRIAWWPQVIEELDASREHYRKLGMAERIDMDLHDGGHEIRVESGVAFLKRWLEK